MNGQHIAHASSDLLERYVRGDSAVRGELLWSLEAHLEACQSCRARLAAVTREAAPGTSAMVEAVWAEMQPTLAASAPARPRHARQWLARWAAPAMGPWLVSAILVVSLAGVLGPLTGGERGQSLLTLLLPLAPLLGVAAAWTRGLDPAYELVAATPRAGLYLVLRRTLSVLIVVIPLLVAASVVAGISPALCLLPALACTSIALALGSAVGVGRAAAAVAAVWSLALIAPGLLLGELPAALEPRMLPAWAGALAVAAVVVLLRGRSFVRIPSY